MIRSALKAGLKKVLGVEVKGPAAAPPPPAWKPSVPKPTVVRPPAEPAPAVEAAPKAEPPVAEPAPVAEPEPVVEAAPKKAAKKKKAEPEPVVEAAPQPAPVVEAAPAVEAPTDTVGAPAFSLAQVQELFDEMVRPALQGDGGDITLVKIEANDIYVRLVGSCSTCPSSVLTMKMGVEALLKEELPGFGSLIQVD